MKPREEQVRLRLVRQWVRKADQDLRAAESLLADDLLYPSCFHSQQAAEKYLKALLTWHAVEFPKTHVIGELLDLLSTVDADLTDGLSEATVLNPYAVEARYPSDLPEPDLQEARLAQALAQTVRDVALERLPSSG